MTTILKWRSLQALQPSMQMLSEMHWAFCPGLPTPKPQHMEDSM